MSNWVVSLAGPRHVRLEPCPTDRLGPGQVRVRTRYSGISAGTELTLFRGSNPRLRKDWDTGARMFVPRQATPAYPVVGFGYEEVGEIVEVAPDVAGRRPGQLVWGIWGHRAEAVLPATAAHPLPPGLDPLAAVFARPGAIALTAVLAGDLHLGDWVGVFGQGVIGLLGTRLAALSGARVVAVDRMPGRLAH
ncbi:oxidoreductase, partial [Micromonospora aurantiaca]|nr:oxidoreductase [Micromonospora aurantiaca]